MMRVLIVDDDIILLTGLRRVLQNDYEVMTAGGGEAALAVARRFHPSAVFVDILLDQESGLDVTELLRRELPGATIVLMSGCGIQSISEQTAAAVGADGFLPKTELGLIGAMLSTIEAA